MTYTGDRALGSVSQHTPPKLALCFRGLYLISHISEGEASQIADRTVMAAASGGLNVFLAGTMLGDVEL